MKIARHKQFGRIEMREAFYLARHLSRLSRRKFAIWKENGRQGDSGTVDSLAVYGLCSIYDFTTFQVDGFELIF